MFHSIPSAFIGLALLGTSLASNDSVCYSPHGISYSPQPIKSQVLEDPYPYEFPVLQNGTLVNDGLFPMPDCYGFELYEATIDQMQAALASKKLTSFQLAMCYLKRVYQTDGYIR